MASDDGEAMTRERLAEIESRVIEASYPRYDYPYSTDAKRDMSDLLAEVERRRAREATLLEFVQAVAEMSDNSYGECSICGEATSQPHNTGCPVAQARALLASADERSGGDGA